MNRASSAPATTSPTPPQTSATHSSERRTGRAAAGCSAADREGQERGDRGDPRATACPRGSSPSSATTCSRSAVSGSLDSCSATARRGPPPRRAAQHLGQLGRSPSGLRSQLPPLLGDLEVQLLVLGASPRCTRPAPSRWRRRPGSATPERTTRARRPAATDTGDQRRVGDQAVHRAEDGGPQPAAGDVGVAVVVGLGRLGQLAQLGPPLRPARHRRLHRAGTGTATLGTPSTCRRPRAARRRRRCPGRGCRAPWSAPRRPAAGRRTRAAPAAGWRPTGCPGWG